MDAVKIQDRQHSFFWYWALAHHSRNSLSDIAFILDKIGKFSNRVKYKVNCENIADIRCWRYSGRDVVERVSLSINVGCSSFVEFSVASKISVFHFHRGNNYGQAVDKYGNGTWLQIHWILTVNTSCIPSYPVGQCIGNRRYSCLPAQRNKKIEVQHWKLAGNQ